MIMNKYLIIGGGMTAYSAINAIRKLDEKGTIGPIDSKNKKDYHERQSVQCIIFTFFMAKKCRFM